MTTLARTRKFFAISKIETWLRLGDDDIKVAHVTI